MSNKIGKFELGFSRKICEGEQVSFCYWIDACPFINENNMECSECKADNIIGTRRIKMKTQIKEVGVYLLFLLIIGLLFVGAYILGYGEPIK